MRKLLTIVISFIAVGLAAQTTTTPPVRTYPDIVTSQTNASIALSSYKSNLEGYVSQDGTDIWNLQAAIGATGTGLLDRMAAVETAVKAIPAGPQGPPGPAGPAGPLAAPIELMLVIPYGSTGFSITSLGAQTEYPPAQRTRRKVDFTNVHQVRSCANIISPGGTSSTFVVQIAPDTSYSTGATTLSGPYDITVAGLNCSVWQNYAGPGGDQFIRVLIGGAGSVTLDFISIQIR